MMWTVPQAITAVAGAGEGSTNLNAFDHALMDAGIADLNFLKVTSICPKGARVVPMRAYTPGMIMPAVYTRINSHTPGERIAAAVGIGIGAGSYGVIMEYAHAGSAENAEQIVRRMVEEAMASRGLEVAQIVVAAREHIVGRMGCVIAAVLFWPE